MESGNKMLSQVFAEQTYRPGHVHKYDKTGSRADMSGELYEVKMTLLLFLRGINGTAGFYLASNVDGAGAFDDILFKFRPLDAPNTFKTCFLQLKHKQRKPVLHETEKKKTKPLTVEGLYSNNGDFSLGKYHESYCEVVNRMKMCAETDDIMFNGSFDNTWFVIYTNAPAERQLLNHEKTKEYSHPDRKILSSGGELEFIFHFHEEDAINYKPNKKLPSDLSDSKKEFLAGLKIYCGQASETELNLFIEFEVKRALETSKDVTTSISKDLTSKITDWWRDSSDVLTETSSIWQEIVSSRIDTMNASIRSNLDGFGVSYDTQVLHSFYLSLTNNVAVVVTTLETHWTSMKVLQTLDRYYNKEFIFIDLKSLLLKKHEVLCLWQSTWCHVLAIESSSNASQGELVDLVNELSRVSPGKLVLLVLSKTSQTLEPNMLNLSKDRCIEESYRLMQDSFSFTQLDCESRIQIMEKQVIFQGIPVSLGSVVKENAEVISGNALIQLLTPHNVLAVGPRLDDVITYYVPRRLKRFDCLNNNIIANNCRKEYFVISNILEQEIQDFIPYGEKVTKYVTGITEITSHCLIAEQHFSQQDFVNVCSQNSRKSFHWLTFDGGSLAWKQSSDNIALIRQNLANDSYTSTHSNAIDDRVVLLTAEPGMGKSTLMTHMAKQVQEEDPSLWIIRLNLNDTTSLLEEIDEDYFTDIDNTINFLSSATIAFEKLAKYNGDDFEANFFKSRLKSFENVVVILDGFDEISPDFTNEVISLLKCLLKTKVRKLWVTSRIAMRNTLEQALSLISYTLEPFSVDDQHSFLIRYWKSITNIDALEQLKQFAALLLEVTSTSLNDQEKEFTSIPLQTFMLAEAFENEITCFVAEGINRLPTRLNLLELYERFIEKKQNVYYKEKAKWDTSKAASRREIQRLKKLFLCNHMNAALVLLLSTEQLRALDSFKLEDAKDFLEDIANEDEKRGIIDGIVANKPHFIHRTFAEYFLALWLSQHLTSAHSVFQNKLSENYQTMRYFFDCILAKECQLHNAVLSGDKESIKSFLSKGNVDLNMCDKGMRSVLHLAASYPDPSANQSMVEMLLDQGAPVNAVDTVFQWTPLGYADSTGSWRHIDELLRRGSNPDDLVQTRQDVCNVEMLSEAARRGYLKLLAFALDQDVDVNLVVQSQEASTLLHVAACSGSVGSVACLLGRGANLGARDVAERTPLHLASHRGHSAVVGSLLGAGADLGARDGELSTPLHWAASYGRCDVLSLLIGRGADVTSRTADGISPLQLAAGNGHLTTVKILLAEGADLMARDLYGTTPLHEAAERGRMGVVTFLLDEGADVNAHDADGRTPGHWASVGGHLSVVEYLLGRGGCLPFLHPASENGHLPVVTFLLERGANINARDQNDATPLLLASRNGHLKVVEFLVGNGANITLCKEDGRTPLYLACETARLPVVCFLADNGADVMSRDQCGQTPLHSAAEYGHLQVVQYLVAKGAVLGAKDGASRTPLELATVCQQWDTVQWLAAKSATSDGLMLENT